MNQKELKELIDFLIEKDIAEFELERGDVKVKVKRASAVPAPSLGEVRYVMGSAPVGAATAPPVGVAPAGPVAAPAVEEALHMIPSPIVGTYYECPTPGAPPFIKVGDQVSLGQVLCIVEAMKLMNEIESDVAGEVVKLMAKNGQPIEYGQPLFAVRPAK